MATLADRHRDDEPHQRVVATRVGRTMLASAEVYAENNQACIITPFILAGAMAPTTSAGVVSQTLAESLVGMAFCQLVRPGAPVIFGSSPVRCRC